MTFHPEYLLGYAAIAAYSLQLRAYDVPPPESGAAPEPAPGFAGATGDEADPCDFAAAGYQIRRHTGREDVYL